MQRHRAGLSLARSHRQQPVLPRHLRKVLLFVRWHQPRLVREDPDLIVSGRVALLVLLHMSLSWFFSICRVPVPAEMRCTSPAWIVVHSPASSVMVSCPNSMIVTISSSCLLYTSDAADDLLCVDLGGRRIIKKKKKKKKTKIKKHY